MHRFSAGLPTRLNDLVDQEIGLSRGSRANGRRLIRQAHMQSIPIGVRIDGNRPDTELARRLDDAASDLTPIGNQYLMEHEP